MEAQTLINAGKQYLLDTYSQVPVVFSSGKGCYLTDVDGKQYLDFVGGIAVNALGYGDAGLTKALKGVLDSGLLHCSNLYYNTYAIKAAKTLTELADMDRVFFCNSGAEANEAALKLARKFGHSSDPIRTDIVTMVHSFHGRTYGAITATGQDKYHVNFDPLPTGFSYALFNDLASVKATVSDSTCAIMVEPIQGEGGIVPATKEFLQGLRDLCDEKNLLLIFDEVQCGMGRSGKPFAFQTYGVQPDILTLAKALAGGVPAGAMVTKGKADRVFSPGDHASTFGGNALAMAGACEMIGRLQETDLCSHVEKMGAYLRSELEKLVIKYPTLCLSVRGRGLLDGLVLSIPPRKVVDACFEQGLLVLGAGYDVLRFVPPLVVEKGDIDKAMAIVDLALASLA
ncbi:acetylornithine/succinylornithine aminotransferase [Sphaerochaeta pleomorpha str. Grapes]|uniref:Acetylornithine aminotransferase n=1 Tax=Sphaerochaeta pleomorpha (strain ATCC BAA-1885 / DSM 22778 / Grapes) TaxID=158190 RepID=G8QXL9_SPHPG|nr:aspartate aminotransferase family protein [Sphaerochaeta pleomorpha]AEV29582.1 acetylornithine/succinylornithine aminotransferase [Sphaerochaeta pleomorpha str. Grapes]